MIKFKGRSSIKQYLPKKPIKRGYKLWLLADKSGYCYRFDVYTGKVGNQITKNLGEKVVNTITSNLVGKEHKIYFANYFTSVNLLENIKSKQINACGVVNKMRKYLPSFSINIKNRGEYESFVSDTGIMATQWIDNKPVLFLSNFHSPNQLSIVYRRNRMGIRKSITCLSLIADYNDNMNAVDKFDQLMSNYSLDRRIQIRKHKPNVSLEIRKRDSKQLPERSSCKRCALCSTKKKEVRTLWSCTVCKVPLCLGKNMCFNKYHT
ncbi:PiggyBac transposable element-derived protein 4, partial [Anthophora quadrimaculata]